MSKVDSRRLGLIALGLLRRNPGSRLRFRKFRRAEGSELKETRNSARRGLKAQSNLAAQTKSWQSFTYTPVRYTKVDVQQEVVSRWFHRDKKANPLGSVQLALAQKTRSTCLIVFFTFSSKVVPVLISAVAHVSLRFAILGFPTLGGGTYAGTASCGSSTFSHSTHTFCSQCPIGLHTAPARVLT